MTDTMERTVFEIEAPALRYPSIYEKRGFANQEKFSVTFSADLVPADVRLQLHNSTYDKPMLTAKSNLAPLVTERRGRYELMAMLFQEANVRNIPRDRLLRDVPATVKMKTVDVDHSQLGKFKTLVLLGVTVDVDDMRARLAEVAP